MRVARRWSGGLSLALLALTTPAPAQTDAAKKDAAPSAPDTRSLARYAPAENLGLYAEWDGLDTHADAWKKTAAFKMLNETPLGTMLEEVIAQLVEQGPGKNATGVRPTGTDIVATLKHAAHHGFVFAAAGAPEPNKPNSDCAVLVFRGGAKKEIRASFARLLFSYAKAEGRPRQVALRGRTLVVMPGAKEQESWAWWTEQDDLVILLGKSSTAEIALDVLEGKRKNALDHPIRAELARPESGFTPVAWAFLDAATAPKDFPFKAINRLDYRWGFQDNALMSVTRIVSPKPRAGWLTLLDQPAFDKKAVPAVPEGVESFTVVSIEPAKFVDALIAMARSAGNNPSAAQFANGLETALTKGKMNVRKDFLPYLGPRMAFYAAPGKSGEAPASPAPGLGMGGLNPLALMTGMAQMPKYTLVAEVNNPTAFGRALDGLIIMLNQSMKAQAKEAADRAEEAAKKNQAPGGTAPPPDAAPRSRGPAPAPEFRSTSSGKARSYLLNVPTELAKLPAGVRPTIRFEGKYVALSLSPNAAQQALELANGAAWTPPADLKETFEKLPAKLIALNIDDPRPTLPSTLASLPGMIQATLNGAILQAHRPNQPMPGNPPYPGGPSGSSSGSSGPPAGAYPSGGPPAGAYPSQSGSSSNATGPGVGAGGSASPPGTSVPGAFPGAPGTEAAEGLIQIRVDPSKMPTADALKPYLFPGSFAVVADDQSVQFVTRQAFPNVQKWMNSSMAALLMPAIQRARAVAKAKAAATGAAPSPSQTSPRERDPRGPAPR
jgi:hypothetical protein